MSRNNLYSSSAHAGTSQCFNGLTENDGGENGRSSVKLQDMKLADQCAGHEIARHENAGHKNDGQKMMAGCEIAEEQIQC